MCSTCRLFRMRVAALLFTCVAFSAAAHGAHLPITVMADWCIFCWAFSFACTLLVLLVELFGLQARVPVSWSNFPITVACYATLLCLSAISTVFSCLAAVAYMGEVSLSKARPGEVAGYMATAPGLLKVCQTFLACIIFILISSPVTYDHHPALTWCMAVYCICFIVSMAVVVLCVGEWTGCLPIPFSKFLLAYGLLAVIMYLSATILWPVFQFNYRRNDDPDTIAASVITAINFLLYFADLVYSARLVDPIFAKPVSMYLFECDQIVAIQYLTSTVK
uniref:MARVEL domain-containing protein n=1 Tax=Astatotilapia calliptera TaxID=8154 RepID=A0A3P8NDM9_ASTCA